MKFSPVSGTDVLFCVWQTRVKDYDVFVRETSHSREKPDFNQGPTHPEVNVTWNDAVAFCKWLTAKEREAGLISTHQEYRLPKDWEWSVAVGLNERRDATPKQKDEKIKKVYPWNRGKGTWPQPKGAGNYSSSLEVDVYDRTSPVGSFTANAHGLFDLCGNVWEWCDDLWEPGSKSRVSRGGSWAYGHAERLLSSCRRHAPGFRSDNRGFRVVLSSSSE